MKVVAISGSLRRDSWNTKLLRVAEFALRRKGVEVEELSLQPLPIYNPDMEAQGYPEEVVAFRDDIQRADAVVIASPEYNNATPGALKNAIDWASRSPNVFDDKAVFIMGASPGRSGAVRMHMRLSYTLSYLGAWVVPQPRVLLPQVQNVMSRRGEITDELVAALLDQAMDRLIDTAVRLGGSQVEKRAV